MKFSFNFQISKQVFLVFLFNIFLTTINIYFINSFYSSLPSEIPLFYTLAWGTDQLTVKSNIYLISGISVVSSLVYLIIGSKQFAKSNFELFKIFSVFFSVITIIAIYYQYRIIRIVSVEPIVYPDYVKLIIIPAIFALVTTILIMPFVLKLAKRFDLIDDPLVHNHPGMLLTSPVPRAGGLAFYLGVLLPALFILPITSSQKMIGLFLGSIICVVMGIFDDKKDIHPILRAILQIVAVVIVILSGFILVYIPNPFGEAFILDQYSYTFNFLGDHTIYYVSVIAAIIWSIFLMNFMSMANGTDGVYSGLVVFSSLTIAIISLQNLSEDPNLAIFIKLAGLMVGAGLGMAVFTWPKNKILWGFGATAPALMIAALSILGSTKVAMTLIVLIIPFLDGVIAMLRRIRRGKLPIWGDKEHFHHKLLDLGWSKQKIAIFYWTTTGLLSLLGIVTSGQTRAISLMTVAGLFIVAVASVNIMGKEKVKKKE